MSEIIFFIAAYVICSFINIKLFLKANKYSGSEIADGQIIDVLKNNKYRVKYTVDDTEYTGVLKLKSTENIKVHYDKDTKGIISGTFNKIYKIFVWAFIICCSFYLKYVVWAYLDESFIEAVLVSCVMYAVSLLIGVLEIVIISTIKVFFSMEQSHKGSINSTGRVTGYNGAIKVYQYTKFFRYRKYYEYVVEFLVDGVMYTDTFHSKNGNINIGDLVKLKYYRENDTYKIFKSSEKALMGGMRFGIVLTFIMIICWLLIFLGVIEV